MPLTALLLPTGEARAQACIGFPVQTNQTCTNSVTLTNTSTFVVFNVGLQDAGTLTVTNTGSGTIMGTGQGGGVGIFAATDATVTNSGTIKGTDTGGGPGFGILAANNATVTNSGIISGSGLGGYGISADTGNATVTNSGTITGTGIFDGNGIYANGNATVTNSGTITGSSVGIYANGTGNVTNSGTIIGNGGTAIQFNANGMAASDTLTVLPGARFGGLVNFGGGADRVNFGTGSYVLNTAKFDSTLSTITTGGNPYFVTGNFAAGKIVVADVSNFGAMNNAVLNITGWISSVLPETPAFEPSPAGAASAFAAIDAATSRYDAAFASFPADAMSYSQRRAPVFTPTAVNYSDGSSVWAKGFGGLRQQQTNGAVIGSTTTGYGGALGYERGITPELRLGGFLGASTSKTNLDANAGGINTDAAFAGLYGRATRGASFLDLSLTGGQFDNSATRNISGGLTTETASASYKGWFINPALTLGHRFALDRGVTVTPAVKARYVAARFDGYTETGSSSNLTVDSRDMQAFEERAELTLAKVHDFNSYRITVRMTGGVLSQQRSGSTFNVALLGQSFAASSPDQKNVNGLYGGAGLDWQIGRFVLFTAGEVTATNDSAMTAVGRGGVRVAW